METEREKGVQFGERKETQNNFETTMIEFAVEDILFEEMAAATTSTSEDNARSPSSSSGLILPSMTIDPADTKTPYSDATQVGFVGRKRRS